MRAMELAHSTTMVGSSEMASVARGSGPGADRCGNNAQHTMGDSEKHLYEQPTRGQLPYPVLKAPSPKYPYHPTNGVASIATPACIAASSVGPNHSEVYAFQENRNSVFGTSVEATAIRRIDVKLAAFHNWYISRYCNSYHVALLDRIQRFGHAFRTPLTAYFRAWSITGEAEFFFMILPTVMWAGYVVDGIWMASILSMGQYVTGTLKDATCCPRPPCPPLELRGRQETHDREYGFPSTHSSHSTALAYLFYTFLKHNDSTHTGMYRCMAIFLFVNVCYSRLYLGMHWIADILGGCAASIGCILFHHFFFDWFVNQALLMTPVRWWMYLLIYVIMHVLSIAHVAPKDACPCYMDSLRFVSVFLGAVVGVLIFRTQYGTITARDVPKSPFDVILSRSFLVQWAVSMLVMFIVKESTSFAAGKLLERLFKFLSGAYALKVPAALRRPYLVMATLFGWTTKGDPRPKGDECFPTASGRTSNAYLTSGACAHAILPSPAMNTSSLSVTHGFVNSAQVWSLRTHNHWWLWEAHRRTVSYFCTGVAITWLCPLILRECMSVGLPP